MKKNRIYKFSLFSYSITITTYMRILFQIRIEIIKIRTSQFWTSSIYTLIL